MDPRARIVIVLVLAGVVATGCSSGDGGDGAAPTSVASAAPTVATSAPSTSAPATSADLTTVPATTGPAVTAATTAPVTTVHATTVPVTYPPGSVEADVVAATIEAGRLYTEALQDPFDDDKVRAAGQAHAGPVRQTVIENIADYRLNNWRSTPNPAVPASIEIYPGGVVVDAAAGTASVTYCDVNSAIVVATGGNADGSDLVVNDDVSALKIRLDLELVDARWVAGGGELLMDWPAATTCPDLP